MKEARRARLGSLLLELLVVFLGVGVALAADAWWEVHEERARALEYMEALLADLQAAEPDLRDGLEFIETRIDFTRVRLAAIRSRELIPDSVPLGGFQGLGVPRFPLGQLAALVETGELRLISDGRLRATLVAEYAAIQEVLRRAGNRNGFQNAADRRRWEEKVRVSLALDPNKPVPLSAAQGSSEPAGLFQVNLLILTSSAGDFRDMLDSRARIVTELNRVLTAG